MPPDRLVSIVFPLPVDRTFTYALPEVVAGPLEPGIRVIAPVGRRLATGFVSGPAEPPPEGVRLREIADVLDPVPLLPPDLIAVTRWMAEHYLTPWGMVLEAALPREMSMAPKTTVKRAVPPPQPVPILNLREREVLDAIPHGRGTTVAVLKKDRSRIPIHAVLSLLEAKGCVTLHHEAARYEVRGATEAVCVLDEGPHPPDAAIPELDHVAAHLRDHHEGRAPLPLLSRELGLRPRERKALAKDPRFRFEQQEVICEPHFDPVFLEPRPEHLTADQSRALGAILPTIGRGSFSAFLIHGVTASGKTEVYLRAAEATLGAGKGVIVLVPEIGLTPQILGRFRSRFREEVAVFHSALSAGERLDQWRRVREGKSRIALGARSAIFAPVRDVGLIVVDEEQDASFKQDETPRYNGRDVALVRGQTVGATVLLGSATPSLEAWHNTLRGRSTPVCLETRIGEKPAPAVSLLAGTASAPLPQEFLAGIGGELAEGGKVLVLLNRRGFSPAVLCRQCRWIADCPNCSVHLTFHLARRRGVCHYCDHSVALPDRCPRCGGIDWGYPGAGTQRLEEELVVAFGREKVLRMDRDTTTRKGSHQRILKEFLTGTASVLVGTQMIAKGHHLPDVGLVGILGVDDLLSLPDFRAAERAFHLVTQAAGRAGRGRRPGKVAIVTDLPDHYVLTAFASGRQREFYDQELEFRRQTGFPPFSRMARIVLTGPDEAAVGEASSSVAAALEKAKGARVELLGPAVPPLARLKNLHRRHLILRSPRHADLRAAIRGAGVSAGAAGRGKRVGVVVDIDPTDFL